MGVDIQLKAVVAVGIFCLLAGCSSETVVQPADLVFRGEAIYTANPNQPWAKAVAVAGGKIVHVGDGADIGAYTGEGTQVIELGDGMLMPGFHDAHMHPMSAGTTYLRCPLDGLEWPDGVMDQLKACVSRLDEGEWLRATGLDEQLLEGEGPGIEWLDEVSAGHPALISADSFTSAWVNSRALELAEIGPETPDPEHGEIVRGSATGKAAGQATGVLRDAALGLVWPLASDYSGQVLREGLRLVSEKANSLGIVAAVDAAVTPAHWDAYRAAEMNGEMTLRVTAALRWQPAFGAKEADQFTGLRETAGGPLFMAHQVKLFLDGDSLSRGASVLEPYADGGGFGQSYYGEDLNQVITRLDQDGFDLHMHAYGDQAVRDALDAIALAIETNPPRERRHQLAHVALVDRNDLPKFAELGVTANIQPLWAWMSEERGEECEILGAQRCGRLLPFRDLFDSGARVVAGSDWISESMSPLYNIEVAITRRLPGSPPGSPGPAWNPDQRVALEQMIRAYTIDAAWQSRLDHVSGSIEVGKAADLVVLEKNLFEIPVSQIAKVPVLRTYLNGTLVYARD